MEKLVDVLRTIHGDLIGICVILLAFVVFKDCHGSSTGIVDELRSIKNVIQNKRKE